MLSRTAHTQKMAQNFSSWINNQKQRSMYNPRSQEDHELVNIVNQKHSAQVDMAL